MVLHLIELEKKLDFALKQETKESLLLFLKKQREAKPLPEQEALLLNKAFDKTFSRNPTKL